MTVDTRDLEQHLRGALEGEVHFDAFSRGRFATDASFYQVLPLGVAMPRTNTDVAAIIEIAMEREVPLLFRGGGTSQCGQTVNDALVVDVSAHLNCIEAIDPASRHVTVQPGLVLDELNRVLRPHGLWFPVDVSTASRATLGGMAANNSCGSRSIVYGTMRDNVVSVDAVLADGTELLFGEVAGRSDGAVPPLFTDLLAIGAREREEIRARFPDLLRRVGGYNLDALMPGNAPNNLSHLLVGSEGTLAYSRRLTLKLSSLPRNRVLGICHFPSFYAAMANTERLVALGPSAVELVDRSMIELARDIELLRPAIDEFVRGEPQALLLVEFAGDDAGRNRRCLDDLESLMGDLGFAWTDTADKWGGVVPIVDDRAQKAVWDVRKEGLNIMMSMRTEGKPVSFVEDCAVRLSDLADYTARLDEIFAQHGTRGTWYAHASVGTLHVRPVLNLKQDTDVRALRSIAEQTFEMVREYRGSHSGEHGDGIVRSEFHRDMFGERLVQCFAEVKHLLDPAGILNPNRIVDPPRMDDRSLFRYPPGYRVEPFSSTLDWSGFAGEGGGFQGAVEMCNNNGACRKLTGGVMCPSYRVTRSEQHLVRGRANSLRLAISGQLGADALTSDAMAETLSLCVSCKGCRRECPTGVDMAKMKIEVQAARAEQFGISLHDRLVAYLPRYAPAVSRWPMLGNLRNHSSVVAALFEHITGFTRSRALPTWSRAPYRFGADDFAAAGSGPQVALWADTFNRYFEPENLIAAERLLRACGYRIRPLQISTTERPLCCGRTFLAAGLVDEARAEARRSLAVLRPLLAAGVPVVGLEPSCLLTLRDEWLSLLPGEWSAQDAAKIRLLDEQVSQDLQTGRVELELDTGPTHVLLHGHCHRKAFDLMSPLLELLTRIPDCRAQAIESSCCGMAGAFGYHRDTVAVSRQMAELDVVPRIADAPAQACVVADGTSCRHQIRELTGRKVVHPVTLLARCLASA